MAAMITRAEWDAIYREQLAAGRQRVEPPTFEEVDALSRGELELEEADRVRESLSYYPELLHAIVEPFPESGDGVLTDDEIAADLAKIRAATSRVVPLRPPRRRRDVLAVAASLVIAIALGAFGIWHFTSVSRAVVILVIYPEASRGAGPRGLPEVTPVTISRSSDYVLRAAFESPKPYADYRFDLLDLSTQPPHRLWSRDHLQREPDATFPIRVSTRRLSPGFYRLVLYGIDGSAEEVASYTLRVREE